MSTLLLSIANLLARYLHIVGTTLLVGGTLFYEMVVPIAIQDLKDEHQLSIFARARWSFRGIVWIAAALLLISGVMQTIRHWPVYSREVHGPPVRTVPAGASGTSAPASEPVARGSYVALRSGWWWVAHVSTGALAIVIAIYLTMPRTPPTHPIGWMRLHLVILLVVIFIATVTRHVRVINEEAPESGVGTAPPSIARLNH